MGKPDHAMVQNRTKGTSSCSQPKEPSRGVRLPSKSLIPENNSKHHAAYEQTSNKSTTKEEHSASQHSTRNRSHTPMEEEGGGRHHSVVCDLRRQSLKETSSTILSTADLSFSEDMIGELAEPTNGSPSSYVSSSSRSTLFRNGQLPLPKVHSTSTTPDDVNIIAPIPVPPMDVHMVTPPTYPEPAARVTPLGVTYDLPVALASEIAAPKKSTPPSEWTVNEVVEWLTSKGFGSDVCDKFIGQFNPRPMLLRLVSSSHRT